MYRYIFFDLDGTLTDPGRGITNAVAYALRHWNIEVADRSELYRFIGPPLVESFMKFYGFSETEAQEALNVYREYYAPKGMFENEVYPGIPEMLKALKDAGRTLILATSKPDLFSVEILKHFGLYEYFDFCACATMDEKRVKKAEIILYGMENMKITDPSACLMVGDREHDIIGAKTVGIRSAGVLYGYGSIEELRNAGADYVTGSPEALLRTILSDT